MGYLGNVRPTIALVADDITDGAVTAAKIATDAVGSSELNLAANYAFTGTVTGVGKLVQIVNTSSGAVATGTTTMPHDDSIPQNTEGVEFLTLAITPTNASNLLVIDTQCDVSDSASGPSSLHMALFQDSTANAIAQSSQSQAGTNYLNVMFLSHYMTARHL